jgi:hypothetical protein
VIGRETASGAVDDESFFGNSRRYGCGQDWPECSDAFPDLAPIRTFGLKLAGSKHSTAGARHIMSAEFTKTL